VVQEVQPKIIKCGANDFLVKLDDVGSHLRDTCIDIVETGNECDGGAAKVLLEVDGAPAVNVKKSAT
jgi:hypothetical protein